MNLFITGGTGFIGKHFVAKLLSTLKSEDRVYVLTRSPVDFKDPRIQPVIRDLSELEKCRDILLDCEMVYHLGACAVYGNDLPYDQTNFEPTRSLVEILSQSRKLKNFVFVSTIGAVDRTPSDPCDRPLTVNSSPHPRSRYGESKLKAETWLHSQSRLPWTIIRPTWVYGRHMRFGSHIQVFANMVLKKSPVRSFNFPGRVPLIHVEDLASALVRCIDNSKVIGKTYIAVTENLSIGEIFGELSEAIHGKKSPQFPVPRSRFFFAWLHRFLPLSISNLFLDYLCAEDPDFTRDFGIGDPVHFGQGKKDVIEDFIHSNGYWVVTGANSGIGHAIAKRLHDLRKKTILVDKETDALEREAGDREDQIILKADLSSEDELRKLASELSKHRIAVLINNAGVGWRGSIEEISFDKIQKTIDVNVKAPIFLTKLLLGHLQNNASVIVNMSSSIAYNPLPGMSVYSASKSMLSHWSQSLAYEMRNTNTVLTLHPSGTYTRFQERAGVKVNVDGKGLLSADRVARRVIESAMKRKNLPILSVSTRVLLPISALLPQRLRVLVWGRLFSQHR